MNAFVVIFIPAIIVAIAAGEHMDDLETFDARSFVTRMLGLGENLFILVFLAPLLLSFCCKCYSIDQTIHFSASGDPEGLVKALQVELAPAASSKNALKHRHRRQGWTETKS